MYLKCWFRSCLVTFECRLGTWKSTTLASLDVGNVCEDVGTSGGLYTLKDPTPLEWVWNSMRKQILAGDFPVGLSLLVHGSKAAIVHQYSLSVSTVCCQYSHFCLHQIRYRVNLLNYEMFPFVLMFINFNQLWNTAVLIHRSLCRHKLPEYYLLKLHVKRFKYRQSCK